jgi:Cu2+-exporting ATPase
VDQLDLTALVVLAARGDYLIGGIMTWLIGLGDIIRARTMGRARREVTSLMSPAKQQAWVEREEGPVSVPVSRLEPGDTVLVYPGDQIPADGVIIRGRALVDQKVLTGESVPLVRQAGDAVYALTMVSEGQLALRVEHIGKETRAGQVVAMIEDAPLSDTRIQNYAAKIGDRLVGPIFGLALATYLLGGDSLRVAGVLILDFASGIRVSAPVTILSAMTGAAKRGLFIKGGKAIEDLARVDAVIFDKTGTLTRGEPVITGAHALDPAFTEDEVLRLAASAEANLKHPAAKAIVDAATQRGLDLAPSTQMDYALGLGLRAVVEGTDRTGGQRALSAPIRRGRCARRRRSPGKATPPAGRSCTWPWTTGLSACSPTPTRLAPESAAVVRALRERGIRRILMLTGDNARAAQAVATEVGITEVIAEAFPEQKAEVVQRLRAEGFTVAVIGDGINDSPAFMRADVGVSLPHGADVAREVADVILLDGDLRSLPRALDLSRDAMGVLRQNVNIVVWPTALGIAASLVGRATPLLSTLISHGTTIIAGLNGLRPLFPKEPAQGGVPGARRLASVKQAAVAPPPSLQAGDDPRALIWPIVKRLPAYLRLAWALSREPAIPVAA